MTIDQLLKTLPSPNISELPAPSYSYKEGVRLGLAVESMKRHMTDEGWQIFAGLESAGYRLAGHALPIDAVKVPWIVNEFNPAVVVLQDKREWHVRPGDFREPRAQFHGVDILKHHDSFNVTILKDSQQNPMYHRESAEEIGCHAWIVYYHPRIVHHLAPYIRARHLIRTYHSLDSAQVPAYEVGSREGCLLSGAVSGAYPLRSRLVNEYRNLADCHYFKHPGYHRNGSATPAFLALLSQYKVAICTASKYGYALRKIIEATAAGCIVVTDLPEDEILPEIDGNLIRVEPNISIESLNKVLMSLYRDYLPEEQEYYAIKARNFYDYKAVGARLAADIETMRQNYAPNV